MKKIYYILTLMVAALTLSGCEKEEVGNTAMVEMAGEWYVAVDAVDADGNIVMEDPFGLGEFLMLTYNNNANDPTKIVVNDLETFWGFAPTVNADLGSMTFSGSDVIYQDEDGADVTATITNGVITLNGAQSPVYNQPIDAISFNVTFSDDPYPEAYGYVAYWVHGWRRTGFDAED